ncbi:SubName: Full=Uncharacterized protein {ECO:0000313/EMBL:KIM33038.1} [Serendipita indica DSM 11827]|nr:SubName: Full=Uncharacterized protein {ECO:0000313/EMBL:KIM33038.1} [Serendipita indica DSM 11827]
MAGFNIIDELVKQVLPLRASVYLAGASLALVVYDWFLTFEEEISLILPTPWTTVKTLYYLVRTIKSPSSAPYKMDRYDAPPPQASSSPTTVNLTGYRGPLTDAFCRSWIWLIFWFQLIIVMSSSYLMLRRLCPLYGNRREITISLHAAFAITYAVVIGLSIFGANEISKTMYYSAPVGLCSTLQMEKGKLSGAAIFVGPLAFESIVFAMTAWKAFVSVRGNKSIYSSPLHQIFFRDGLIHYIGIMFVRLLNIFIFYRMPVSYMYIGLFLLWATVSVSTTRLCINLRSIARGGQDMWSKREAPILSRFEMPQRTTDGTASLRYHEVVINVVTEVA